MKNEFIKLFKDRTWEVIEVAKNSYVAYNEKYFIPFSIFNNGNIIASAVSYLRCDMKEFVHSWILYNKENHFYIPIGIFAFRDKKFKHNGGIYKHNISINEMKNWLNK